MKIVWAERDWLLGKINVVAGFETIVAKLEAARPSTPVKLNFDECARPHGPSSSET